MITRIVSDAGERVYDGEIGQFVEPIPCHRCGVCCERWQPLVSEREAVRLAAFLSIAPPAFLDRYTTLYPLDDSVRLLRNENGACTFLRWDPDGRSACAVHPARPDACSGWIASLQRRECIDGLTRFGADGHVVALATVYPEKGERAAFVVVAGGEVGDDA